MVLFFAFGNWPRFRLLGSSHGESDFFPTVSNHQHLFTAPDTSLLVTISLARETHFMNFIFFPGH